MGTTSTWTSGTPRSDRALDNGCATRRTLSLAKCATWQSTHLWMISPKPMQCHQQQVLQQ
eukprot:6193198-Pyramimonas_sp.AAC.1